MTRLWFLLLLITHLSLLSYGEAAWRRPARGRGGIRSRQVPSPNWRLSSLCRRTPYPQVCVQILSRNSAAAAPLNRQVAVVTGYALRLTNATYVFAGREMKGNRQVTYTSSALQDCMELMGNSMDQLRLSIDKVSRLASARGREAAHGRVLDAQVALSTAFTFQDTCSDELSTIKRKHASLAQNKAISLLIQQGSSISQAIAVALALVDALQNGIMHPH